MNHLPTGLATLTLLTGTLLLSVVPITGAAAAPPPVLFGMDSASMTAQANAGVAADYGSFWVGPWTLSSGWGGPDAQLDQMRAAGVTPAIHFYYWGDAIAQACFTSTGCWSSEQNAQLTMANWQTLAQQLVNNLNAHMAGKPVVVFVETEFNKGDVQAYEPLDGYLADKANFIRAGFPTAKIVMPLGNWNSAAWGTFDRFAAASDFTGLQGMRGSTHDTLASYLGLYNVTLAGAKSLQTLFGKPIFLQDIALSSYPEPTYLDYQHDALAKFFTGMPALKAAGVQAILYRSWLDSPTMSTANYYGTAERYWGLANSAGAKLSRQAWVDGVKAERAASVNHAPVASFGATATGLTASFDGTASNDPDGNAISYAWNFGDGTAAPAGALATISHTYATSGTYTATLQVTDGSLAASATQTLAVTRPNQAPTASFVAAAQDLKVSLDASASSDPDGDAIAFAWAFGDSASGLGRTANHTYAAAGKYTVGLTVTDGSMSTTKSQTVTVTAPAAPFTASFAVASGSNEWWQEVKVTSSAAPAKVEFSANNGPWQTMTLKSWGNWAAGANVVKGTPIVFRATDATGHTVTSASQLWRGAAATPAPPPTTFSATFSPKSVGNDWWVETGITSAHTIAKVEASLGGGAYAPLPKDSWGTFAASLNAPNGTKVVFRATDTAGATATSASVLWT